MLRKYPPRPCRCGRLVSAGRTQTGSDQTQCLICETATIMASFTYPPRRLPAGELFPPPPRSEVRRD